MFCDGTAPNMGVGEAAYAKQVFVDGLLWFDREEEPDLPPQVGDDITASWNLGFSGVNPASTFAPPSTWSEWSFSSEPYPMQADLDTMEPATIMSADPSPVPMNWGKFGPVQEF